MTTMPYGLRGVAIAASAGQTSLGFPYPLLAAADLAVVRLRAGGRSTLVLNTDYTVAGSGAASTSATVTLVVAALAGDVYELVGLRRPERVTDFGPGSLTSAALNDEFNRLIVLVQELRRDIDRAVRRPLSDAATGSLLLPPPDGTETRLLALLPTGQVALLDPDLVDEIGNNLFNFPLSIAQGGTGASDAAGARSALGLGALALVNSVGAALIDDGSVGTAELAAQAVTLPKLADGAVTYVVESIDVTAPPTSAVIGALYIVPPAATGAWSGQTGKIALATDTTTYTFLTPAKGWRAVALAERKVAVWNSSVWVTVGGGGTSLAGRLATHLMQGRFGGGLTRAAVLDSKTVIAWGDGASGKAAHAGTRDALLPEVIPFENPPTAITKLVSANGRHFVLDSDGWVHSAGDGANGVLGHGNTTSLYVFKRINAFFSASIKIRDIVVDRANDSDVPIVAFITDTDRVYTTGYNNIGQRGDGTTANTNLPTQVIKTDDTALTNVDTVSIGGYPQTVAVRLKDGTMARWGQNTSGQLGDGTTTHGTKAAIHPSLTSIAEVLACSGIQSGTNVGDIYVRKTDGTLLGAGYGGNGDLAQGGGDLANKSSFVSLSHTETFKRIFGGDGTGVRAGITATDKAVFWGRNAAGPCGDGTTTHRATIYQPAGAWQGTVTDIRIGGGAGTETSYVLAGGAIYAAGYNANHNAIDGATTANVTTHAKIVGVDGTISEWTVAGDATHYGLLVRTDDGRIMAGGAGAQGELGSQAAAAANPVLQDVIIPRQRGHDGKDALGTGVKTRWLPAKDWSPRLTAGCAPLAKVELGTQAVMREALAFAQDVDESAEITIEKPAGWNGGPISFVTYWSADAGAGSVVWSYQARAYKAGDGYNGALSAAATATAVKGTSSTTMVGPETSALTVSNVTVDRQLIKIRLTRAGTNVADTLNAFAMFEGAEMIWTEG